MHSSKVLDIWNSFSWSIVFIPQLEFQCVVQRLLIISRYLTFLIFYYNRVPGFKRGASLTVRRVHWTNFWDRCEMRVTYRKLPEDRSIFFSSSVFRPSGRNAHVDGWTWNSCVTQNMPLGMATHSSRTRKKETGCLRLSWSKATEAPPHTYV